MTSPDTLRQWAEAARLTVVQDGASWYVEIEARHDTYTEFCQYGPADPALIPP